VYNIRSSSSRNSYTDDTVVAGHCAISAAAIILLSSSLYYIYRTHSNPTRTRLPVHILTRTRAFDIMLCRVHESVYNILAAVYVPAETILLHRYPLQLCRLYYIGIVVPPPSPPPEKRCPNTAVPGEFIAVRAFQAL